MDDGQVDRVQDDDRIRGHAQGRGRVDPVALPTRSAQFGKHLGGVVTALGRDDDVATLERGNIKRVLQPGFVFGLRGRLATRVGGGKKYRLNHVKIAFGDHPVDQHRADHAAPAHQADQGVVQVLRAHCNCAFQNKSVWADSPGSSGSGVGAQRSQAGLAFSGRFSGNAERNCIGHRASAEGVVDPDCVHAQIVIQKISLNI